MGFEDTLVSTIRDILRLELRDALKEAVADRSADDGRLLSISQARREFRVGRQRLMHLQRSGELVSTQRACPGGNVGHYFRRIDLRKFFELRDEDADAA